MVTSIILLILGIINLVLAVVIFKIRSWAPLGLHWRLPLLADIIPTKSGVTPERYRDERPEEGGGEEQARWKRLVARLSVLRRISMLDAGSSRPSIFFPPSFPRKWESSDFQGRANSHAPALLNLNILSPFRCPSRFPIFLEFRTSTFYKHEHYS